MGHSVASSPLGTELGLRNTEPRIEKMVIILQTTSNAQELLGVFTKDTLFLAREGQIVYAFCAFKF